MAIELTLIGGGFQDCLGNPLAYGYLTFKLIKDAISNTGFQLGQGREITIQLDSSGNVSTSPTQSIWPNDLLTPSGTYYMVSAYTEAGQLVWGPNAQQVLSTTDPFNIGVWIPGLVNF